MSKRQSKTRLLTHRTVAQLCDCDTETIRDWVAIGEFPEPRAIIKNTWFYDADMIETWIETGRWPEGAKFKHGMGKGREMPVES